MSKFLRSVVTLVFIYCCRVIFAKNEKLEEAMRKVNIIPKILSEAPNETLEIAFSNNFLKIETGRIYPRDDVRGLPTLNWTVDRPPVLYTILATGINEWELFGKEPNTSLGIPPDTRLVHWLILNCPHPNKKRGTLLHPYRVPMPPQGYDRMYHLFLVYKQTKGYDFLDIRHMIVPPLKLYNRYKKYGFQHLSEFTKHFELEHLVAANFFGYQYRRDEMLEFLGYI